MPRIAHLLLAALLLLGGCETLAPDTAAIAHVQETYKREFMATVVPAPVSADQQAISERKVAGLLEEHDQEARERPPSFVETLDAIRAYRVTNRGREKELARQFAHLEVLQGMIYIQSRQFGMARAVSKRVAEAGAVLGAASGTPVRDRLFAEAYPDLIDGWEEIEKGLQGKADRERLGSAAERLSAKLLAAVPAGNLDPALDEGAIYLATTTAIYWVWLHELRARDCENHRSSCTEAVRNELAGKVYYRNGHRLIGAFLAPEEIEAAGGPEARNAGEVDGRLRYLRWYAWLNQEIGP